MNGKSIKRGDIFYILKKGDVTGSEQEAGRPGIVVSNDTGNMNSPVVSIVYMTTKEKKTLPTHAEVFCKLPSTVLCEQVYTISKERVGDYITSCSPKEMKEVNAALAAALGLENYSADAEAQSKELKDAKDTLEALVKRMQEREEVIKRLEEQLMLSADDENISIYEPEDESFYKRFYHDLFHSGKKIEIKVG